MKKLIYNQNRIPAEKLRYGFRASADTGCGWIAVYNALTLLDYDPDPQELVWCFEDMLPVIHGNLGTMPLSPALFFKKHGFDVRWTSIPAEFDRMAYGSDVCILYYHWIHGIHFGAHFVTVTRNDTGFYGINTYQNSEGPDYLGRSIREFLERRKYFAPVLIGVNRKAGNAR